MALSIFDLDNTLLNGDSDYLWGQFLVEQGIVDGDAYEQRNAEFYQQYKDGTLNIYDFLAFSFKPLTEHPLEQLQQWHRQFMREKIEPIIQPKAIDLIEEHRQMGNTLMIITATNSFITGPIASRLGIDNLLATDPEIIDGRFTGGVTGIPCFKEGKVERLRDWLEGTHQSLQDSWFFSDSHNDIPLLKLVAHAVAVDPDDSLEQLAKARRWQIISLHS